MAAAPVSCAPVSSAPVSYPGRPPPTTGLMTCFLSLVASFAPVLAPRPCAYLRVRDQRLRGVR